MSAKPNLLAEAKELLRNAEFADGIGTVFTQDCEALEAAVEYEETQARGTRKLVEALQAASEQLNRQHDYDAVLNMRSKAPDGNDYNKLYEGVPETLAIVNAALADLPSEPCFFEDFAYRPVHPRPDSSCNKRRLMLRHDPAGVAPMIFVAPAGEPQAGWVIGEEYEQ